MKNQKLKRWEAALLLALCITFCHSAALPGAVGCNWWGVVFSGLAEEQEPSAPAWNTHGWRAGGMELRFRLLDLLAAQFGN